MSGLSVGRRLLAKTLAGVMLAALAPPSVANAMRSGPAQPLLDDVRCRAIAGEALRDAPVKGLVIASAAWHPAGMVLEQRGSRTAPLPAHCEVQGRYGERPGLFGGPYATGFRMRLPAAWNGRYFFQGGGGSNGVVADAAGFNGAGNRTALERGYAVIAQDSGHDNDRNRVADHGGELVFGFDPGARADYGHASLKPSYDLGRHLIRSAYGRDAQTKIFWGCSKGGQEGMAFAQRYPDAFDGIVAMAPGFSLPRAAIAEAWDTQQFAGLLAARGVSPSVAALASVISPAQFAVVADAVRAACDGLDGARDGIIAAVGQCTTARVQPQLRSRTCKAGGSATCLAPAQVNALIRVMNGPTNRSGQQLYASWPWDAGIGTPGWRAWKVGLPGVPALNVVLGAGSLAAVFTAPPTALVRDPQRLLEWQLAFDLDRDSARIYAVVPPFTTSAWQDAGMRSTDLSVFRANGGKLIVPHGMADPVFSANDTIAWWEAVDRRNHGRAADFVRVFPVPGMNHCAGGPATDRFDSLTAIESWVLQGHAPATIPARAGPEAPWPGRQRPLCPYPQVATAAGETFRCSVRGKVLAPGKNNRS